MMQLTRTKMELAVASREKAAAAVKLEEAQKEVVVLSRWHHGQEATDLRRVQYLLHEEKMKVKGEQRKGEEAVAELRSLWAVLTSNGELHAKDKAKWAAERMELRAELKAAKEAAVVTTKADGDLIGGTAEASAGTARKAVGGAPTGGE